MDGHTLVTTCTAISNPDACHNPDGALNQMMQSNGLTNNLMFHTGMPLETPAVPSQQPYMLQQNYLNDGTTQAQHHAASLFQQRQRKLSPSSIGMTTAMHITPAPIVKSQIGTNIFLPTTMVNMMMPPDHPPPQTPPVYSQVVQKPLLVSPDYSGSTLQSHQQQQVQQHHHHHQQQQQQQQQVAHQPQMFMPQSFEQMPANISPMVMNFAGDYFGTIGDQHRSVNTDQSNIFYAQNQAFPVVPTMLDTHAKNMPMQDLQHHLQTCGTPVAEEPEDLLRRGRRPLPRRHTVSTPYSAKQKDLPNDLKEPNPELAQARFRKLLKSKRHRSLGRLELPPSPSLSEMERRRMDISSPLVSSPLSAELEQLTHEQLMERVMELEQEKRAADMLKNTHGNAEDLDDAEDEDDAEEEEEKFQCLWMDCFLELRNLEELINHVKDEHIGSGKALYYCGWKDCSRTQKPFTKRHKMHNHLRTHTGERPFVCNEPGCGKRFSRPDSLTTHTKIHSNIRPYLCQYPECGKAYYHLRSLRKHERLHEARKDETGHAAATDLVPPMDKLGLAWSAQQ
ncbi:hypothetical protein EC973_008191 [Apophysomyces ossiformis]|uniref:C2H2-type domain-containing protein n=1 Tax=Apophysomyces ossiformis TaxID=679940 RepID=A0A8H7ETR9_9FUNG|nr:hypothetical protein EC973_008191 [Apophysomyces ossiformis]